MIATNDVAAIAHSVLFLSARDPARPAGGNGD